MRRVELLLAALMLCLTSVVGGCGWGVPTVVQPDYEPDTRWVAAVETNASMDASAAAQSLLPRFAESGGLSAVATDSAGEVPMPPAEKLRVVRIVQRYRVATGTTSLEPMGFYDVGVTAGGDTCGVFAIRRTGSAWEYGASGYPVNWWGWDMRRIAAITEQPTEIRLVSGAYPLSWFIVTTATSEYAFPSVHMGPVSIAPPGTSRWRSIEIRPYPVEAVFSRIRRDGC